MQVFVLLPIIWVQGQVYPKLSTWDHTVNFNNWCIPKLQHIRWIFQCRRMTNFGNDTLKWISTRSQILCIWWQLCRDSQDKIGEIIGSKKRKVIFALGIGHYTKATEIRHMGYTSAHVSRAVTLAHPTYFATFPSCRLVILLTGRLREQQKSWAEWRRTQQ